MGLLCGCIGTLWSAVSPCPPAAAVLAQCGKLAAPALAPDLATATGATAGVRRYLRQGITGIRGEAAAGYPSLQQGLEFYQHQQAKSTNKNDALVRTLLYLIAHTNDTNLYHRGGAAGAQWASDAAKALLPAPTTAQIEALDDAFIQKNLSPGGCADLLAAVIFLDRCQHDL